MTPEIFAPSPEPASAADEYPELEGVVTEDGKPLDSTYQEKLHRLLTETLFASWPGPGGGRVFSVHSNVGLFSDPQEPPLVPDVMLALDVPPDRAPQLTQNRSYFIWIVGKPPDVVLEFVSDRRGREDTTKKRMYAGLDIPFYVIFDPKHKASKVTLKIYRLVGKKYQRQSGTQFEGVGLGVTLWRGKYEEADETWLRWCDTNGAVIPTGKERADDERRRADDERRRADDERGRADDQQRRADEVQRRAERLTHRAERMAARLRELGIDPDALNGT
jgi:Uma2 family endonuclease